MLGRRKGGEGDERLGERDDSPGKEGADRVNVCPSRIGERCESQREDKRPGSQTLHVYARSSRRVEREPRDSELRHRHTHRLANSDVVRRWVVQTR